MMDLDASMHPPAYDSDDDAAQRPGFCLLERCAYFDNRQNGTTAVCDLDEGKLHVTFCAVRPPLASYLCVHATAFLPAKFAAEPEILAAEGPLALIRVVFGCRKPFLSPSEGEGDYFVYHAGGNPSEAGCRPPSLKRLPHPAPNYFDEKSVAIVRHCPRRASTQRRRGGLSGIALRPLRRDSEEEDHDCADCNYVIAALLCPSSSREHYELCRYHSKTSTWSAPELMVAEKEPAPFPHGCFCKPITIGGEAGTVAWAVLRDHSRGIIFCDVLAITDSSPRPTVLRCLELPHPVNSIEGSSGYVRDITLVDGSSIVYTEVQIRRPKANKPRKEYVWNGTTWRIKINDHFSHWHMEYKFGSSEISKSLRRKLQIHDPDDTTTFYIGVPILSLQDDAIVYILAKTVLEDLKLWVLAIDMKRKKVQEVYEFDTKRYVYLGFRYLTPSRISKYLQGTPKRKPKRQKMMLQPESYPGICMVGDDDMELDDDNVPANAPSGVTTLNPRRV